MAEDEKPKRRRKISRGRYAVGFLVLGVVTCVLAGFALGHIGNYEVISNSMAPTLRKGDRVMVDQRPHYSPAVGDVIVLSDPFNPEGLMTKRVAGVGGDKVDLIDGYLYVEGRRWAPPGEAARPVPENATLRPLELVGGQILVLGDNREQSEDSLFFGPTPAESVKGRLWFIYWPPGRMGRVR